MATRSDSLEKFDDDVWDFIFCYFFNGEAGVIIVCFSGLTLMMTTFFVNLYSGSPENSKSTRAAQYFLLFMYIFIMCLGYFVGISAVYMVKSKYGKCGAFLIGVGLFIYILFTILSVVPGHNIYRVVCLDGRCPDHHWLVDSQWRTVMFQEMKGENPKILLIIVSFFYVIAIVGTFVYTIMTFLGYAKHVAQFEDENQ